MANHATELNNKVNGSKKSIEKASKEVSSSVMNEIQTLSEDLSSRAREMTTEVKQYYKTGHKYVKNNPVKSLAIAAGAGLLVGGLAAMLLRRRESENS